MHQTPRMPGTDRDRALALGVLMGLTRDRDWYFTYTPARLAIMTALTLGIWPAVRLTDRFDRWRRAEKLLLHAWCDAMAGEVDPADQAGPTALRVLGQRLVRDVPIDRRSYRLSLLALALLGVNVVTALLVHSGAGLLISIGLGAAMTLLVQAWVYAWHLRQVIAHRDRVAAHIAALGPIFVSNKLDPIDVPVRESRYPWPLVVGGLLSAPFGIGTIALALVAGMLQRSYISGSSASWRTQLAHRLAELRWPPVHETAGRADLSGVAGGADHAQTQ